MEFAPLLLLILIPAADTASESTAAIQAALYQELGPVGIAIAADTPEARAPWQGKDGRVLVRYFSRLVWKSPHKIHIELWEGEGPDSGTLPKAARDVAFSEADSIRERGRAIGLVLAHLLREQAPTTTGITLPKATPPPVLQSRNSIEASMEIETYSQANMALGPSISANVDVRDYLWVHGFVYVLQGFFHGYNEFGFGTGATWPALRTVDSRFVVGPRLEAALHREAVSPEMEDLHGRTNVWSLSLEARLWGTATIWRSLQMIAGIGARAQTSILKYSMDEEDSKEHETSTTYQSKRFRFHASLGLGISF